VANAGECHVSVVDESGARCWKLITEESDLASHRAQLVTSLRSNPRSSVEDGSVKFRSEYEKGSLSRWPAGGVRPMAHVERLRDWPPDALGVVPGHPSANAAAATTASTESGT
jgi:hypothetical protein